MSEFRELYNEEGHHLEDNFRPVQPLYGRVIFYRAAEDSTSVNSTSVEN